MKLLIHTIGSLIYLIVWFFNALEIGMSHSAHLDRFNNVIYRYYFAIMIFELIVFLFISQVSKKMNQENRWLLLTAPAFYLCFDFAWRIVWFTQYGEGYYFLKRLNLNESLMVFIINAFPLFLINICTVYMEKIANSLFGWGQKLSK